MEQLTAWVIRWNKMWFANVHGDVGPHLWAEFKGLYMENKNGVKVVAKYDKIQARNFTLVLQCRTWRFSLGLASSSFSDTSSTASRGSSGSSFGLSPVWGPSLEHAFSMDFHINEAQAKFKAVSCPELPLAAWISHLDNPLEMGLWWVEVQRYYWQSQGATPNHLNVQEGTVQVLMPSRSSGSSKSFGEACIFFGHLPLSLPQIHLRFLQPCRDYRGMNTMTAVLVIACMAFAWQASKKCYRKTKIHSEDLFCKPFGKQQELTTTTAW